MGAVVDVREATRRFGKCEAVAGVSFDVRPGEVIGLVGVNGAGKTTLIKLLAGILDVTSGSIRIDGHPQLADVPESRRRLGYVPDMPALFSLLTPREHLDFVARVFEVADADAKADALLRASGLEAQADVPALKLSLGNAQRVGLAGAFLHDAAILLLDEPLTGLDPLGRRWVQDELAQRARDGAAVVVSSHQLDAVQEIATRIILLHGGRIHVDAPLSEILAGRTDLEDAVLAAVRGAATAS